MKKRQKFKKNLAKKDKLLLETSVQINKIVYDSVTNTLTNLSSSSDFYTSYFVAFEFKSGLIKNLIDFYLRVKITDTIPNAISSWSNSFKQRELKNKLLLEALMLKFFSSIDGSSKERYLAQVEAVIFNLLMQFEVDIKSYVGDFGDDEIVKFKIRSNEDYEGFISRYNSRQMIPLTNFWETHLFELEKILGHTGKKNKAVTKICLHLEKIKQDCKKADTFKVNKGIGDAVIATDSPKNLKVVSFDTAFEYLCESLGKSHLIMR